MKQKTDKIVPAIVSSAVLIIMYLASLYALSKVTYQSRMEQVLVARSIPIVLGLLWIGLHKKWWVFHVRPSAIIKGFVYCTLPTCNCILLLTNYKNSTMVIPDWVFWNGILVAIGEELIFRGYILHTLKECMSNKWAIIVSSCLFGACHLLNMSHEIPWAQILNATCISFVYATYVVYGRDIYTVIILHATNNVLVQTISLYIQTIREDTQIHSGSWLVWILYCINAVCIYGYIRERKRMATIKPKRV